jgi:type II secretory pathway component PulF
MARATPAEFHRQLATLLDAGLPISRSLDTLGRQFGGGIGRSAREMQLAIDRRASLVEAARQQRHLFSPLELNLVHAGEVTGQMGDLLRRMADARDVMSGFRRLLVTKMLYPVLVIHVAILARALVAFFAASDGGEAAVGFLIAGFGPLYGFGVCVWLLVALSGRLPPLRLTFGVVGHYLPIVGGVTRRLARARFSRSLECMYNAGIAVVEALPMCARACGSAVLERQLRVAEPLVRDGESLTTALTATGAFDPMTLSMVATGEESGALPAMLAKVAETAEEEARHSIERMGILIPFILYLIVAGLIGYQIIIFVGGYVRHLQAL